MTRFTGITNTKVVIKGFNQYVQGMEWETVMGLTFLHSLRSCYFNKDQELMYKTTTQSPFEMWFCR